MRARTTFSVDIIGLLIVGVLFVVLFVFWERYLEQIHEQGPETSQKWWTPPPLMPVSIWARQNGKVAAVLVIAFVEWSSFTGFTFWAQVSFRGSFVPCLPPLSILLVFAPAILPRIPQPEPDYDHGPAAPHASDRPDPQRSHRPHSRTSKPCVPR